MFDAFQSYFSSPCFYSSPWFPTFPQILWTYWKYATFYMISVDYYGLRSIEESLYFPHTSYPHLTYCDFKNLYLDDMHQREDYITRRGLNNNNSRNTFNSVYIWILLILRLNFINLFFIFEKMVTICSYWSPTCGKSNNLGPHLYKCS